MRQGYATLLIVVGKFLLLALGLVTAVAMYVRPLFGINFRPQEATMVATFTLLLVGAVDILSKKMSRHAAQLREEMARAAVRAREEVSELARRDFCRVRTRSEMHHHLAGEFERANIIRIVDPAPAATRVEDNNDRYLAARRAILRRGGDHHRVVYVGGHDDLQEVIELMQEHEKENLYVSCLLPEQVPPLILIPLIIVDDRKLHFGEGILPKRGGDSFDFQIESRDGGGHFLRYFETLDAKGLRLKDDSGILWGNVERVRRSLERPLEILDEEGYDLIEIGLRATRLDVLSHASLELSSDIRRRYFEEMVRRLAGGEIASHRRLLWRPEHLDALERWMSDELRGRDVEVRYHDALERSGVFYFQLLDNDWALIPVSDSHWVKLNDAAIQRNLRARFEHLWRGAGEESAVVKRGALQRDVLDRLRAGRSSESPHTTSGT